MEFAVDKLPPFANEAVRAKFKALEIEKANVESTLSGIFQLKQRIKLMEEHSVNVGSELTELQHVVR
jgi:hypothetical protein